MLPLPVAVRVTDVAADEPTDAPRAIDPFVAVDVRRILLPSIVPVVEILPALRKSNTAPVEAALDAPPTVVLALSVM